MWCIPKCPASNQVFFLERMAQFKFRSPLFRPKDTIQKKVIHFFGTPSFVKLNLDIPAPGLYILTVKSKYFRQHPINAIVYICKIEPMPFTSLLKNGQSQSLEGGGPPFLKSLRFHMCFAVRPNSVCKCMYLHECVEREIAAAAGTVLTYYVCTRYVNNTP